MESILYKALKADTVGGGPQKRVVLSPFGREFAKEMQKGGGGEMKDIEDKNNEAEKVKALDGTIQTLLVPYQTIPDTLSNRKKKQAKHEFETYHEKIERGYRLGDREKFAQVSMQLQHLNSTTRPGDERLF